MARLTRPIHVALALVSLAGAAAAEPASAADKAVAEGLFQDGRKLMKAGDLEAACPKFAESYRLAPRLGTLLNLATCHEKQGKTASAWAEFTEAAAIARQDKRKEREKYARDHASALEKKLSRVVFEVAAPRAGTTLELDGEEIGKAVWGTPVPVDPGSHELAATAPGHQRWSTTIEVERGPKTITIEVPELEPATAAGETDEPPARPSRTERDADRISDDGSSQRTLGWIALGVGVVGVGVGSWFGLQTFSKQNESEDHCNGTQCDPEGVKLRDDARTTGTISTIGFAAGAVGIGAGVVLLLTAGSDGEQSARRLWIAPGLATVSVGGTL